MELLELWCQNHSYVCRAQSKLIELFDKEQAALITSYSKIDGVAWTLLVWLS